jgi:hypothetical protein
MNVIVDYMWVFTTRQDYFWARKAGIISPTATDVMEFNVEYEMVRSQTHFTAHAVKIIRFFYGGLAK